MIGLLPIRRARCCGDLRQRPGCLFQRRTVDEEPKRKPVRTPEDGPLRCPICKEWLVAVMTRFGPGWRCGCLAKKAKKAGVPWRKK